MSENHNRWQVLTSTPILDLSPWLRVWLEHVRLPNGVEMDDFVRVAMRSWVAVFALTPEGRVPLVRQYRIGIDQMTLELPAGYLEDDEPPERCAERELREEVGAEAASYEAIGRYAGLASRSDMWMHVVLARDAQRVAAQQLEATEAITVAWVTLAELRELWRTGQIVAASHATAVACGLDAVGAL